MEDVQPNLYQDLLDGKALEPAFLQQLEGDESATSKNPTNFGLYLLIKVEVVPSWVPQESYVTIDVY